MSSGFITQSNSKAECMNQDRDRAALSCYLQPLFLVKETPVGSAPITFFPVQPPVSRLSNAPGVTNHHSSLKGNPLSPGVCLMNLDAGPSALLCSSNCYQRSTNQRHIPVPCYTLGHRIRLSKRDLPLGVESKKAAPLLCSMRINLTFHVSKIKPVNESSKSEED